MVPLLRLESLLELPVLSLVILVASHRKSCKGVVVVRCALSLLDFILQGLNNSVMFQTRNINRLLRLLLLLQSPTWVRWTRNANCTLPIRHCWIGNVFAAVALRDRWEVITVSARS